ncbi:MAG: hypothetical protein IJ060_12435 [Oscillospiraceae bacterium]|nr:hypothetical protein [Oscillospiraceae bacterium]MBQ8922940.1 hypothetical protein [Oscillospiraceae bacterium]
MAFCKYCGRPLGAGEQCHCAQTAAEANNRIFAAGSAPGYPVQQPVQPEMQQAVQPIGGDAQPDGAGKAAENPKKKTGIIIIAAAVLLLIVGILVWLLFLRGNGSGSDVSSYETPVSQFFKGINQKDYRICIESITTERFYRQRADERYDGDLAEFKEYFRERCESKSSRIENFYEEAQEGWNADRISYSYRISGKERLDDYELREIEDDYEEIYEYRELSSGYRLNVKVTVKADDKSETSSGYLTVVKTNDGWRLVPESDEGFDFDRLVDAEDLIHACMR